MRIGFTSWIRKGRQGGWGEEKGQNIGQPRFQVMFEDLLQAWRSMQGNFTCQFDDCLLLGGKFWLSEKPLQGIHKIWAIEVNDIESLANITTRVRERSRIFLVECRAASSLFLVDIVEIFLVQQLSVADKALVFAWLPSGVSPIHFTFTSVSS